MAASEQDKIVAWSSGWLSIVTTPAEVGSENAQEFWTALAAACASHALTIADMTGTVICGDAAVIVLLMALRRTDASGGELWLAVSDAVDRLISATAISGAIPRFSGLREALASLPARRPDLV